MKGTVKFFNDMKGYGFVAGEDGKEYFIHQSGLQEGVTLQENDEVTFDVEQGAKGDQAANVVVGQLNTNFAVTPLNCVLIIQH